MLPEPKYCSWREAFWDFGWQFGIGFQCNATGLRHGVRTLCHHPSRRPESEQITVMKQLVLRWFWRKLGAA